MYLPIKFLVDIFELALHKFKDIQLKFLKVTVRVKTDTFTAFRVFFHDRYLYLSYINFYFNVHCPSLVYRKVF